VKVLDKVHAWVMHMLSPQEHSDHLYNAVDEYFTARDSINRFTASGQARIDSAIDHLRALRDWYREQQ
jgi:hypothetical protein